ncbi:MAG: leucine--tRNA ligase [Patescibacteria group bacterium]
MQPYDPAKIEKKWQAVWEKKKVFQAQDSGKKPKYYILDMFPYPSGEGLHVGHPKGYIATDVMSRAKRMQGFNVLHPMGFDAFGLPAENYAIATKTNPDVAVKKNVARFKKQLEIIGLDYDWSREINTTDPKYYKWTQWIFLKLLEKGLAYESNEPVNWCPKDKTVLSNEDVENGKCERCGTVVEKKPMRQWVLKITAYADQMLKDLDLLDWPEAIKESQRNWIGKSEGAEVDFKMKNRTEVIKVFTTRIDTLMGATYVVLAPEHELISKLKPQIENWEEIEKYRQEVKKKTEIERTNEEKEKTGAKIKGVKAVNPANGEEIPIWIADYVLNNYGTGAIMAVPSHDERDLAFAKKYNLPIKEITLDWSLLEKFGKKVVKFKLRDWVFSRQRYWGEPIPVLHDGENIVPLSEKDLPLELPKVKSYEPSGTGESPLANISKWVNIKIGKGKNAKMMRRETNTMPQWAGSSWYYLRYMDPKNNKALVDSKKEKYWNSVDMYVGGAEHATRHLIYARFWHKFLFDIGVVSTKEPFKKLQSVGLIMGADGRKMSKRFGNVINPDNIIKTFGADTLRVYEMFMGPFDQAIPWGEDNIIGVRRFLERVWKLQFKISKTAKASEKFETLLHKTIKKVGEDIESMSFNTAISSMMILTNEMDKQKEISKEDFGAFLKILSPFAPHIAEEIWANLGNPTSQKLRGTGKALIATESWPEFDKNKIIEDKTNIVVQINGKVRAQFEAEIGISESEAKNKAISMPEVQKWLEGKEVKKVIFVPNKIINFVVL